MYLLNALSERVNAKEREVRRAEKKKGIEVEREKPLPKRDQFAGS